MIAKKLLLTAGLLSSVLLADAAFADFVLPGRCHMGLCGETRFISKDILRAGSDGMLYSVELAYRSYPIFSEPSGTFGEPNTSYVYCSTSRPAYIFNSDGTYYASFLNPGGNDWFGYNMSNYPIYWATCHNFVGPGFFSERMTANAIRLGYPLNLRQDQIELENILGIINY